MLTIRRRDPARRMARFYRLGLQGALSLTEGAESTSEVDPPARRVRALCAYDGKGQPGPVDLVREWGRIGSPGTVRSDPFPDQVDAEAAAERLAAAKRRKGYQ
jgi:predicted DNA-binding WGR domain protein